MCTATHKGPICQQGPHLHIQQQIFQLPSDTTQCVPYGRLYICLCQYTNRCWFCVFCTALSICIIGLNPDQDILQCIITTHEFEDKIILMQYKPAIGQPIDLLISNSDGSFHIPWCIISIQIQPLQHEILDKWKSFPWSQEVRGNEVLPQFCV